MDPVDSNLSNQSRKQTITVGTLTRIWERVLARPNIRADENFFDIGGSPPLAVKVFAEIANVYAVDVHAETISHAPTIRALAALMERPSLPRFSTLIPMKPGSGAPPVFLAHGLDGGLIKLALLARAISTRHPIYGIQATGFDGQEAMDRVEDMAPPYVAAIRVRQPRGPYFLIGYSLGGMVMMEVARRLTESGQAIGLLAMIDAYPHLRQLSPGQGIRVVARRANRHLSEMVRMSPLQSLSYVAGRLQNRSRITNASGGDKSGGSPALPSAELAQRVRDRATLALGRYRPRYCPGKIKFVRSETGSYFPKDPAAVWGGLVDEFECETVPGDHLNMLSDHFEDVAAVLSRYLAEAFREKCLR